MDTIKIDCTKIEKKWLFAGKNGAKYLDIILIEKPSQWGDTHMVVQSVPKEAREAGERGPILGNAKIGPPQKQQQSPSRQSPPQGGGGHNHGMEKDDIPFASHTCHFS